MEGGMLSRVWTRRVQGKTRLSQVLQFVTKFKPPNTLVKIAARWIRVHPEQSVIYIE